MGRQEMQGAPLIRAALDNNRTRLGQRIVGKNNRRIGCFGAQNILLPSCRFFPDGSICEFQPIFGKPGISGSDYSPSAIRSDQIIQCFLQDFRVRFNHLRVNEKALLLQNLYQLIGC
ncbi:hypothetical protein D3C73_1067940 [compost metagenome]